MNFVWLFAGLTFLAGTPQEPEPSLVAYHAKSIHLYGGGILDNGWLLVENGKVVGAIEHDYALPPFVEVVDFGDRTIVPGFVAADSPLTGSGNQGDHALGAHRRAWDSYSPYQDMSKALERGITTVYLSPDRNRLVGGRGAVVKTAGTNRVLNRVGDLRISLESSALNPPSFYRPPVPPTSENPIGPARPQAADSLAGAAMALRESAQRALAGADDAHSVAFAEAIRSKVSLRVTVDSTAGARIAGQLARDWDVPLILESSSRADVDVSNLDLSQALQVTRVPLHLNLSKPSKRNEDYARYWENAVVPGREGRWTWLVEAALALKVASPNSQNYWTKRGLSSITFGPANLLGVGARVGRLLPGFDADFVVLEGELFDPASSVRQVFIDGTSVWQRTERREGGTVLQAGTLWTAHGPMTGGVEVLLQDGKIVSAGHRAPHPAGSRIVNYGADAHLTAGFVDTGNHFGVGSRVDPEAVLGMLGVSARFDDSWRAMAAEGMTTVVLGPSRISDTGTRFHAVKTGAVLPEEAWVDDRDIVRFDFSGINRAEVSGKISRSLSKGKKYADKWVKWREERAKWEKEAAEKSKTEREESELELRKRLVQGAAPVEKEEVKEEVVEEEEEVEKKEVDPLNGVWEGTIEHEMIPEPVPLVARFHHDGATVIGLFSSPMDPSGSEEELEGEWDEKAKTLLFTIPTEMGEVIIKGEIDAPDHMLVNVELAAIGSVDFEMNRTEIEEEGAAPIRKKRKKKDDGPSEPDMDLGLEGYRALYEGRGVAVLRVGRIATARTAVNAFAKAKIPVVLEGIGTNEEVIALARQRNIGVIVGPPFMDREDAVDFVAAAQLRQRGIKTALQSGAFSTQAGTLPAVVAMAVRHGFGAEDALASLTYDAADLLGLSHRIGRLAPGLDGDVVVHSGPPFALSTSITHVFVNGEEVIAP